MGRVKVNDVGDRYQDPPDYIQGKPFFKNPREHFIYGEREIGYAALWQAWDGHCDIKNYRTLMKIAAKEQWKKQRNKYWNEFRKLKVQEYQKRMAELEADELVEAVKRHKRHGLALQTVFRTAVKIKDGKAWFEVDGEKIPLTASAIIRAAEKGIDIERKALGLVEQVVKIEYAEDFADKLASVISKYIDDPSTLRNIGREFKILLQRQYDELELMKVNQAAKKS